MRKYRMYGYGLLAALGVAWLVAQQGEHALSAPQTGGLPDLAKRVAGFEAKVASLQQTVDSKSAEIVALQTKTAPISVAGNDFTISGKNVFIQDGSGSTNSNTGLGNLTIGYNALRNDDDVDNRTGTHNLILVLQRLVN